MDLAKGELVPGGGDLRLQVVRPSGRLSPQHRQDWSLEIAAQDGELQEVSQSQLESTFEAPAVGYAPRLVVLRKANDPEWSLQSDLGLFVRSRNERHYSKVWITFSLNEEPDKTCMIGLNSLTNTNGSRNWEEAPGMTTEILK